MRVVHNKLSAMETLMDLNLIVKAILRNTGLLPTGKHVLEIVARIRIAFTGPIVWKPSTEDKKYAIFILIMTIREKEVASVDIILAQVIILTN